MDIPFLRGCNIVYNDAKVKKQKFGDGGMSIFLSSVFLDREYFRLVPGRMAGDGKPVVLRYVGNIGALRILHSTQK
jgi:hypothetical protein